MDHVEGRIFWDQSLPDCDRAERSAIYDQLNTVISALHRLDPDSIGLGDYGKHGAYFARQINRWTRQIEASRTVDIPAMDRLIEWLPTQIPEDDDAVALVHGDFRLDNLIFHPSEPRILAVIDWELSTLGHPLADFAYHMMSRHIPPGPLRGLAGLDLESLGIPSESDYIALYQQRSGRVVRGDWNFYLAYNLFRVAAICQGIAKRVETGTASSPQAAQYGAQAGPLAELGWRFAQQAGAGSA
jgi:aminoglycoside phosphotransferase (APT) family kinase protein